MGDLNVSLILRMIDKMSRPAAKAARVLSLFAKQATGTQKQISKLGQTKSAVDNFRKLKTASSRTRAELKKTERQIKELAAKMKSSNGGKKLARDFDLAKRKALGLKQTLAKQNLELEKSRRNLDRAGISTRKLASGEAKLKRQMEQATKAMERRAKVQAKLDKARATRDKWLGRAGKTAGAGAAATGGAYAISRVVKNIVAPLRAVEKAKGELATLGVKKLELIAEKGRDVQRRIAGMKTADFIVAAYDIKSGIATLTDEGVAAMTEAAAYTAKATKSNQSTMTSLFATAYGVFKSQYEKMSDANFGQTFSAMLAKSVQAFKTDGNKMQRAIETAGSGAKAIGMRMSEEMAILGMLQQKMLAGDAGTAVKAFAATAAKAHKAFGKLSKKSKNPVRVRILDDKGMLRSMPDILTDLKKRYGDTLDAFEKAEIQKAFGREEAVKIIEGLYGQEKALKANTQALDQAGKQGLKFTKNMAGLANTDLDAKLTRIAQKYDLIKQRIATAFLPVLDRLIPKIEAVMTKIESWVKAHPDLTAGIAAAVVGLGALLAVVGPILIGISGLIGSLAVSGFMFKMLGASIPFGLFGRFGKSAGKMGLIGRIFRGIAKAGRFLAPVLMHVARAAVMAGIAFMTTPFGWVVAAIAAIAAAAYLVYNNWDAVVKWFGQAWDWIGKKAQSVANWLGSINWSGMIPKLNWDSVLTVLDWASWLLPVRWLDFIPGFSWAAILKSVKKFDWSLLVPDFSWPNIPPQFAASFTSAFKTITKTVENAWSTISGIFSTMKTAAGELAGSIGKTVGKAIDLAGKGFAALSGPKGADRIIAQLNGLAENGFSADFVDGQALTEALAAGNIGLDAYKARLADIVSQGGKFAALAGKMIKSAEKLEALNFKAPEKQQSPKSVGPGQASVQAKIALIEKAEQAFTRLKGKWVEFIATLTAGLVPKITSQINGVKSYLSTVSFHTQGANIMQTLADGMASKTEAVVAVMRRTAQQLRDHLPSSPAKTGPLSDIHKLKFGETIAASIKPGPMVKAMRAAAAATMAAAAVNGHASLAVAASGPNGQTAKYAPLSKASLSTNNQVPGTAASSAKQQPNITQNITANITVNAQTNADPRQIAKQVSAELQREARSALSEGSGI